MSYNNVNVRKFEGLFLQANSFSLPEGAMERAEDVIISRDDTITSRRGFFEWYSPSGGTTLNNLAVYNNTLMAICNDKLLNINDAGTASTNSGSIIVTETSRYFLANKNFYFTTSQGIKKITSTGGAIFDAGLPPGLDLRGRFSSGPGEIKANTQVAYRSAFARKDANDNLLLSSPTDVLILTNVAQTSTGNAWTRSGTVATITQTAHSLAVGQVVYISASSDGTAIPPGVYLVITVPSVNTFTITVPNAGGTSGTLDLEGSRTTTLEISLPAGVVAGDFIRIYRSSQSSSATATPLGDYRRILEYKLASSDISAGVVFIVDDAPVGFEGEFLYTNNNDAEGEDQANERPPLAKDVTYYKSMAIYANTQARALLNLNLITTSTLTNSSWLDIKVGSTTRRYRFQTGIGNTTTQSLSVVGGSDPRTINFVLPHGLSVNDTIRVSGDVSTTSTVLTVPTSTSITCNLGVGTFTSVQVQGLANAAGERLVDLEQTGIPAIDVDRTARAIVKAINRDPSSLVFAKYLSQVNSTPGQILLQAKSFGDVIEAISSNGDVFVPVLPATATGEVVSSATIKPNEIMISKIGENEAVPIVNRLPVGSENKAILRVAALRDSIIVIKEDGIFRINGETPQSLSVTILDGTVICVASGSVALINNQVALLSNQGVCMVSENSVQIISRKIELPISAVIGNANLEAQTSAYSYESERLYILTTLAPQSNTANVVYVYNTLTETWTRWTTYFKNATVGPKDRFYYITLANKIRRERKEQNRLDYTEDSFSLTVSSVTTDKKGAVVTGSVLPLAGDVIVKNQVITKVKTSTAATGTSTLTFYNATNLAAADTPTWYRGFTHDIKMAPYHAGKTNVRKQFAQFQMSLRDPSITACQLTFSSDVYFTSDVVTWTSEQVANTGGWGELPWGLFPWGLPNGTELTYDTQPAPIIRTYVPRQSQRASFIQMRMIHRVAAEPLNIQAIGYQVRGYGERTTK